MRSCVLALLGALAASSLVPAAAWAQSGPSPVAHGQAIEMAAANKITMPMEFWFDPAVGYTGVEGFGADGNWYELILDKTGKVVRAGTSDTKEPAVKMMAAADAALKNGVSKLEGIWLTGGNWVVRGWDAAEKSTVLMIDGVSGETKKLVN